MKFIRKSYVIEAMQFNNMDDYLKIFQWMKDCGDTHALADEVKYSYPLMLIQTLEGTMAASPGDWIVRGYCGEFFPVKPDIFTKTYEKVDE